jgi:cytoskeletal protein CcmA (bactofilin family)
VAGNIQATERVEVQASGVVDGDIRAPRLLVQEGAVVNGAIDMSKREGAATQTGSQAGAKPGVHAQPEPARKTG